MRRERKKINYTHPTALYINGCILGFATTTKGLAKRFSRKRLKV